MIQFEHSVNILLHILFHYDFSQDTIGLRCLSILYTIVCICTSQISNPPLPPFTLAITSLFSTFELEETQAFDPGLRVPVSTLSPRSLFHCYLHPFFPPSFWLPEHYPLSVQVSAVLFTPAPSNHNRGLSHKTIPLLGIQGSSQIPPNQSYNLLPTDLFLPFLPLCTSFVTHTHL